MPSSDNLARDGVCRLTLRRGPFVRSHIIPRALTILSVTGEKAIETGIGEDFIRRPSTWYDYHLVTAEGESILSAIDACAIESLRRHLLVWSGWGTEIRLPIDLVVTQEGFPPHREIVFEDPDAIRLFFISLLWRAAASTRPEFASVTLSAEDLEDLRARLIGANAGPISDYPVHLFQIITKSWQHNRAPLMEVATVKDQRKGLSAIPYVRFYFDGLVAHVYVARGRNIEKDILAVAVGNGDATVVFAHEFAKSRTYENLKTMHHVVSLERGVGMHRRHAIAVALLYAFKQ